MTLYREHAVAEMDWEALDWEMDEEYPATRPETYLIEPRLIPLGQWEFEEPSYVKRVQDRFPVRNEVMFSEVCRPGNEKPVRVAYDRQILLKYDSIVEAMKKARVNVIEYDPISGGLTYELPSGASCWVHSCWYVQLNEAWI